MCFSRSHCTGKERDAESGNDYFEARYYASSMGRFMSPDWSAKIAPVPYAKLGDPQTLNLYAYVGNNPMTRFDADGHGWDCSGANAKGVGCQAIAAWNVAHGTMSKLTTQVLTYMYAKGGNGQGFGLSDVKVGPLKVDIITRKGKDVTRTTDGKKEENVEENGAKVGVGPFKFGLSKTTTQEDGQAPKTEIVPIFSLGKFEGDNAQMGLGLGGCFIVCGQVEVGVRGDKLLEDAKSYTDSKPAAYWEQQYLQTQPAP
jgi:RHS repeat-associated protein